MSELKRPIVSLASCSRRWQLTGVAACGALTLLLGYTLPVTRTPIPVPAPKTSPQPDPQPHSQFLVTRNLYMPGHWRPHPELCPNQGEEMRLLILVSSSPASTARRMAVRLTWGHYTLQRDVVVAFVLGAMSTVAQVRAIAAEDDLYGDLIVSNTVHDDLHTTPLTISTLEWMCRHCPHAHFLLKTEDDVFLNVPWVLSFTSDDHVKKASRTVWGRVMRKALPNRNHNSKNYVNMAEFPSTGPYPDFTTGPAYLMSNDSVRPLLEAATAPLRRYLRIEDVFITGVVAAELGIKRVHTPAFYNRKMAPHPCHIQRIAAVHMLRYHEQFDFWRKLFNPPPTRYCNSVDRIPL